MCMPRNLLHGSVHNNLRHQTFAGFLGLRGKEKPVRARKLEGEVRKVQVEVDADMVEEKEEEDEEEEDS